MPVDQWSSPKGGIAEGRRLISFTQPSTKPPTRLYLALVISTGFIAKLAFAWRFDGYLTGDDLEILQTAAKYALGLVYEPWGLRSLLHPIVLVAPILLAATEAGIANPKILSWAAVLPTAAFSSASVAFLFALARRWGWTERTALAASFLYAVHWLPWSYGATHYARPISCALILGAFLLVSGKSRGPFLPFLAGVLCAAAFAVRFSEGVFLLPLLGFVWWRWRRASSLLSGAIGFGVGVNLFLGLFDAITWGSPFLSLREFFRIMFYQPPPSLSGDQPLYFYGLSVLRWAGPVHLLLLVFAAREPRIRVPMAVLLAGVLLLSAFRYKQFRYLQTCTPFLALCASVGWERLRERARWKWIGATMLVLATGLGLERAVSLLRKKSQSAIAAVRQISALPGVRTVVLEQAWAYGERFYLGNLIEIRDLPPKRPLNSEEVTQAADGADVVAIYRKDADQPVFNALEQIGFSPHSRFHRDNSKEVVVFVRSLRERGPPKADLN